MKKAGAVVGLLAALSAALAAGISACESPSSRQAPPDGGASTDSGIHYYASGSSDAAACEGGKHTRISGRIYDPANVNPLYGVTVYVPAVTPAPLPAGTLCAPCTSLIAQPVAAAVTDAEGRFTLTNVPDGPKIPLVVQARKWRMQYTVDVAPCQDNPQPDHSLRLPKNRVEGDLPHIAVSTGAGDSLECLLHRIGIDDSEYVGGAGTPDGGHVHIFSSTGGAGGATVQGGGSPDPSLALWDKASDLMPYDLVLLSCEDAETANLTDTGRKALFDYAIVGGRVFASHYHYAFFTPTGAFAAVTPPYATWTSGAQLDNGPISGKIVTTFPQGGALAAWLGNVGALQNGELPIDRAGDNAQVTASNTLSRPWITADQGSSFPGYAQYFNLDVSSGGLVCGRVVYSDLHASSWPNGSAAPGADYAGTTPGVVPQGCSSRPLTAQEDALEFMIFDLSSWCEVPSTGPPIPPPNQ